MLDGSRYPTADHGDEFPSAEPSREIVEEAEQFDLYAPGIPAERFGQIPDLRWIAVDELVVGADYQRAIDSKEALRNIEKIRAKFTWRHFQPLIVGERGDTSFVVIDGQHRLEAARRCGILAVPCSLVPYDGVENEATAFVAVNRERRQLTSIDVFRAELAANDPDALILKEVFDGAQVKVGRTSSSSNLQANELVAIKACYDAVRAHGEEALRRALIGIRCAYTGEPGSSLTSQLITGATTVYAEFASHENFDDARFVERLGQRTPKEWALAARNDADVNQQKFPVAMRRQLVMGFNKGLPEAKRLPLSTEVLA